MKKTITEWNKKFNTRLWQLIALLTVIAIGIILYFLEVFDLEQVLKVTQDYAQYWWTAVVLITIQVLLYTFALPGSLIFWVVALIYVPLTATAILVTGSTLGALAAYFIARHESLVWATHIQRSRFFHLLEKRGDFLALCALRILPNFPHSVINYGAGILHLPLGQFLASSVIGFTLKNYLYTNAVHGAVIATDPSEMLRFETLAPLVIVALLLAVAAIFKSYWSRIHNNK